MNNMQKLVFLYIWICLYILNLTNTLKCSIIYPLRRRRDTFKQGRPCLGVFFYLKGVRKMMEVLANYLKSPAFLIPAELFLRIIIAVLCGLLVGIERTNRGKEAGIRTHTIVALASCLMMIISQYGFSDFFANFQSPNVEPRLDPSRIAAQIVSGIGFLGAGTIFIHKNVVTGLTTAAGIWAIAGVGMAIGSGMYFIGISCTVVIIVVQLILHKSAKFSSNQPEIQMSFVVENSEENVDMILEEVKKLDAVILETEYTKKEENLLEIAIRIQHTKAIDKEALIKKLYSEDAVRSAKF